MDLYERVEAAVKEGALDSGLHEDEIAPDVAENILLMELGGSEFTVEEIRHVALCYGIPSRIEAWIAAQRKLTTPVRPAPPIVDADFAARRQAQNARLRTERQRRIVTRSWL